MYRFSFSELYAVQTIFLKFCLVGEARICYASPMPVATQSEPPLYMQIAEGITKQVAAGSLRSGDRVPSLRQLSRQQRVSMSTALQAYLWLENRGYLESRPQSGFYVRAPFSTLIPEPQFETVRAKPPAAGMNAILADLMESA